MGAFLMKAKQEKANYPNWRFIFNALDSHGSEKQGWRPDNTKFEDNTIKFLTSVHLQMRGKYFVINGNSWANILVGLLAGSAGGCSFVSNPMILDLRLEKNYNYLLCGILNERSNNKCDRNKR